MSTTLFTRLSLSKTLLKSGTCRTFIRPSQVLYADKKKKSGGGSSSKGGQNKGKAQASSRIGTKQKSPGFSRKKVTGGESKIADSSTGKGAGAGAPRVIKVDHPLFQVPPAGSTLPDFESVAQKVGSVGTAVSLPSTRESAIRVFGVPKTLQQEMYHLPDTFSVIREVTLSALEELEKASTRPSSETRVVLTGPTGCGKSVLLLQMVNYCAANKWVVLYVPRAIEWVNNTSPYSYDAHTRTFHQPAIASQLLQQLSEFNSTILPSLHVEKDLDINKVGKVSARTNLYDLVGVGIKNSGVAVPVLNAVMQELGKQSSVPVLIAVDDFQALYCASMYRDPLFNRIRPYHLSTPRLMLEYASGIKTLARGAVVGAISTTHTSFLTPLELNEVLGLASANVYVKRSADLKRYAEGLRPLRVPAQLSVDEAASVFEVWARSNALHSTPTDDFFLAKYAETGGNAREFIQRGLLSTLTS